MTFSSKLIGQPTLYASEGTIYEMKLDVSNQKVKGLKKVLKVLTRWSGIC